jgi:hypothetical protein
MSNENKVLALPLAQPMGSDLENVFIKDHLRHADGRERRCKATSIKLPVYLILRFLLYSCKTYANGP